MVVSHANPGLLLPSGKPNPYAPQQQQQSQNPWGLVDPTKRLTGQYSGTVDQAWQGLNYASQQRWGKSLDDQTKQKIAQNAQAKGWTGGAVNQDHYNEALGFMEGLYGPDAKPGGELDSSQPVPKVGSENAIEEWKKQAPVAGVPTSFRNTNPYYAQQTQNMQKILQNPETMDQKWQDRQNEQQKESAARMMQQMQGQGQQALAGRGFGGGGGQQQAMTAQNQQQMMQQILSGRRDTAQQAVTQNRQDQLNALQASQGLAGQEWDADMGLSAMNLQQMNQNRNANLQEFLGLHGADMDMLNFGENKSQFNKGFGLDFLRYLAQGDQFNRSLGENQRQFNGQQGFNWANMNAQQQQNMMNTIMGWF